MKARIAAALISLACPCTSFAGEAPALLAASATSASADSSPITCLLDPGCQGHWSPQSADAGNDEGIYLQFAEPALINFIEVSFSGVEDSKKSLGIKTYLDGKLTTSGMEDFIAVRGGKTGSGDVSFLVGLGGVSYLAPMRTRARSVYLKIQDPSDNGGKPVKVTRIAFYGQDRSVDLRNDRAPAPALTQFQSIRLPLLARAEATATSILEPEFAYHPAHLFDSQLDMAWSTHGKKSRGTGEELSLSFEQPQSFTELLVWNGYQRSSTHFSANGRVSVLELTADSDPKPQDVALRDQEGMQALKLPRPITGARKLRIKIKGVFAGSKYKDVLLSEVRFKDAAGNILLPVVGLPKNKIPTPLGRFVDRSFVAFLHSPFSGKTPECPEACNNSSIRVRSNGTFVIYKDYDYGGGARPMDGSLSARVIEGNWEPKGDRIRIFGKKYTTTLKNSSYLQESLNNSVTGIFQSDMTIEPYDKLSQEGRMKVLGFLFKSSRMSTGSGGDGKIRWLTGIHLPGGSDESPMGSFFVGENESALLKNVDSELRKRNPYYVDSTVYSGLVLPVAEVGSCADGC